MKPVPPNRHPAAGSQAVLLQRRWLSDTDFELELTKPPLFHFIAGQRITISHRGRERDYSLISAPADETLGLCVKCVKEGAVSLFLAAAEVGTTLGFTGPHGYFTFKPSPRHPVFVATGTGIAPFLSMARSGVEGFTLLHGVHHPSDLYYEPYLRPASARYVPCVTQSAGEKDVFPGRVTQALEEMIPRKPYDFYLAGRREMIRDVVLLVDELFPSSLVYVESFT